MIRVALHSITLSKRAQIVLQDRNSHQDVASICAPLDNATECIMTRIIVNSSPQSAAPQSKFCHRAKDMDR